MRWSAAARRPCWYTKVLHLHLVEEVPTDRIAVLTFTNKAANEVRDRIHAYSLHRPGHKSPPPLPYVGTFHSVARAILTHSDALSQLGFSPDFTILDENERHEFCLRVAEDNGLSIKYISKLDRRASNATWLRPKRARARKKRCSMGP